MEVRKVGEERRETDKVQSVDLEALDGGEVTGELEFRQIDDTVAAVSAHMTDDDEGIDVRLREEPEDDVGGVRVPGGTLKGRDLEDVGYHVAVRDHDSFL